MRNKFKYQNLKFLKTFWILHCRFAFCILSFAFILLLSHFGFCDTLRLKEITKDQEGNEVEILEEREDSFIIKVPKDEIEMIKKKRPTEIKAWREKRILWEDSQDYITIYLPKEKIVLPEGYTGEEYDSAQALEKELKYTGAEGRPEATTLWKGTGRLKGRILKDGQPLVKAKLKIVNVSPQPDTLSRIFGQTERKPEDFVFEAISDELGRYEFNNIPLGEYDIYWSAPGTETWYRRLSEKPDIAVRPGETVEYKDIEIRPSKTE